MFERYLVQGYSRLIRALIHLLAGTGLLVGLLAADTVTPHIHNDHSISHDDEILLRAAVIFRLTYRKRRPTDRKSVGKKG